MTEKERHIQIEELQQLVGLYYNEEKTKVKALS